MSRRGRPRNHRKRHARKHRQTLDRKREHLYAGSTIKENIYPRVLYALDTMDDLSAIVWSYVRPAIVPDDQMTMMRQALRDPWHVLDPPPEFHAPLACSCTHLGCELFFTTKPLRRSRWLRVPLHVAQNIRDIMIYILGTWRTGVAWDFCLRQGTIEFAGYTTTQMPVLRFTLPYDRASRPFWSHPDV